MSNAELPRRTDGRTDGLTDGLTYGLTDGRTQIIVLGYGSVQPSSLYERVFAIFMMLVGGSIYAYMIGAICGLLAVADPATVEFQNRSDLLNEYISENHIQGASKMRLRSYFLQCKYSIRMK